MKNALTALIVLSLVAGVAAGAAGSLQIELRAAAVVPGGDLTLAQVATVSASDPAQAESLNRISLGAAPWPGNARVVTRDNIAMQIGRLGIDTTSIKWSGSPTCAVAVKTRKLAGDEIVRVAREYLESLPVLRREGVRIEAENPPAEKLVAAMGDGVKLEASATSIGRPYGRIHVFVKAVENGRVLATIPVVFQVTSRGKVLFALRQIGRGETLSKSDIEAREIEFGALSGNDSYVVREEDAVGKRATTPIGAGAALQTAMVTEPFAVHKGEGVSVNVRIRNMRITTRGVCQLDGCLGDVVPVTVEISGKKVMCVVTANGSVELSL